MRHLILNSLLWIVLVPSSVSAQQAWPFNPLTRPAVPAAAESAWVTNDVDAYVLDQLESHGLAPAARADRITLVRRLYLDLIGLPPLPEELEATVRDDSPDAISQLIDQLLDDSRYGEHWARKWLDLARYADTAGYEGDPDLPHAWRYRDYVVNSLNRDKPYSEFILEQIAGDELQDISGAGELPDVAPDKLVAMTFLRLAPFTEPRGDETRHEMLSEMTSTVSSVFLGLTVGCAKCHDHRHDAIPTEDFYRLQAFFATIQIPPPQRGDSYQIGGSTPAAFFLPGEAERVAQRAQQLREQAAQAKPRREQLARTYVERLGLKSGFGIQALGGDFGNDYVFDRRTVTDGRLHRTVVTANQGRWTYFTDGHRSQSQGSLSGSNRGHWFGGLKRPTFLSLGAATNGTGKPFAAYFNGQVAHVMVFAQPLSEEQTQLPIPQLSQLPSLRVWLDASDLDADSATENSPAGDSIDFWKDKVAGVVLRQADPQRQPTISKGPDQELAAVEFDEDFSITDSLAGEFLHDPQGSIVTVFTSRDDDESYLLEVGGEGQFIATFVNPAASQSMVLLEKIVSDDQDSRLTREEKQEYRQLTSLGKFLPQQLKRLEPLAMTLRHSFGPPYEPGVPTSRVMIRGEWDNPGSEVEPGFPRAVVGTVEPASIRLDPFKRWPTRGRRKALADWIASPDNPLTARVIVNRLWYWHFGTGIVVTPSDFGSLGGGASHERLLDYLAVELVKNNWSLKSIHRLICNSSTYQQASRVDNPGALAEDPGNVYLWRFPLQRLSAEVTRDRLLHVSGRLNEEHFGPPIFPPLSGNIDQTVKYNESKWATQYGPEGRKRSIYIYQQRTLSMPFMQVFDATVCDESRPRRQASTTALQSLAMYNGELVNTELPFLADQILASGGSSIETQVQAAFRRVLAREAAADEIKRLSEHCRQFPDRRQALISLGRILCNSNEFLYLD